MSSAEPFLDADLLRTATFVRHVELHETLGSTNDRAAELARDPSVELPALVATRVQSSGRGRGQNRWWAAEGALTFSVLLDAAAIEISARNWPQLSLATAVAVCNAISAEAPQVAPAIKWPNDVIVGGGKVGGILIESPAGTANVANRMIIGIGMNINNSWRTAPHEMDPIGAALCDVTGQRHAIQSVLQAVLTAIERRIDQLRTKDPALIQSWQRLNFLAGHRVSVEIDGRRHEGQCREIAHDGALVVENRAGLRRFYSGSVRLV